MYQTYDHRYDFPRKQLLNGLSCKNKNICELFREFSIFSIPTGCLLFSWVPVELSNSEAPKLRLAPRRGGGAFLKCDWPSGGGTLPRDVHIPIGYMGGMLHSLYSQITYTL